ncbi:MAG: diacylglycerol kinase [Burkholderiales bacterium]|nr:diacylglycerol kinase [Burkholderiales bacterium]
MAALGRQIFSDTALSASGARSCASCHVAATGFAAAEGLSVPLGGPALDLPGLRATPSLTSAAFTPAFRLDADGNPVGGFIRDGRGATLAQQAVQPLLNPFERALADAATLQQILATRPYKAEFEAVFGPLALTPPEQTLAAVGAALAAFETGNPEFQRFDSKFDAFQRGSASLDAVEMAGLQAFNDPSRGNCNACHVSSPARGLPALFTDFSYDDIGVPRNWAIAANRPGNGLPCVPANGAAYGGSQDLYDLGLCGPLRADLAHRTSLCGAFKVPSLRNVALRQHSFQNGVFSRLDDVVGWYATRDTDPARWYRDAQGGVDAPFNDLPPGLHGSINLDEVPYSPLLAPTLDAREFASIVAFLCTLSDGWDPALPDDYARRPQCLQARAAAQ